MKNILVVFLCLLSWCLSAQKSLVLKPAFPEAGKSMQIMYSGKLARPDLTIVAHIGLLDREKMDTLRCTFKNGVLKSKLILPDSACFVMFEIRANDTIDTNENQGFYTKVYKKGKPVKGADYWLAYSLISGRRFGIMGKRESAISLMENQLSLYPELMDLNPFPYLDALHGSMTFTKKADSLALICLKKELKTGLSENKCILLMQVMSFEEPGSRDSLVKEIAHAFPKGTVNYTLLFVKMMNTNNDQLPVQVEELRKAFPGKIKDAKPQIDYKLAQYYRKKKDMERFNQHLNLLVDPWKKAEQNNEIAWEMATGDFDLPLALSYSNRSNQLMDSLVSADPKVLMKPRSKERYITAKSSYLDTRSYIFNKMGRLAEALADEEQAVTLNGGSNTLMNEQYLKFLLANGLAEKAVSESERFIQKESTPVIDSLYEVAFHKVYGAGADFSAAMSKLLKNAPDFSLKDMNGETVTLSTLKGKIVILDFWATWCGPCKASFPGMQKAINALKDRQDVVFLFINTWERTPEDTRRSGIQTLLPDDKFTFRVLLDEKVNDGFKVVDQYDVKGVPTKIIIDKSGKIKNRLVGYNGNDEALVKELTDLAEKLR